MSLKAVSGAASGSTSPLPSTVVVRDANGNAFANNFVSSATSTATSASPIVLTAASSQQQILTGSTAQTVTLPDATTLTVGMILVINNNSSATATINNNGGSLIYSCPAGGVVALSPTSISTANGAWDAHPLAPITVTWGSGTTGLVFNTALTTSPSISAGASSATAPAFVPQRGFATTGIGGAGTTLTGIVGGAAQWTADATSGLQALGTTTNNSAAAGYQGESVIALATAVSFPTSTQYGDAANIALTAGDWDVSIVGYAVANGATMVSFGVGISATSGNSNSGLTNGDNALSLLTPSTGGGNTPFAIPNFRVSLSGSATYYFKFVSSYSVATPILNGRISARRVR